jgi:hypothetical protein
MDGDHSGGHPLGQTAETPLIVPDIRWHSEAAGSEITNSLYVVWSERANMDLAGEAGRGKAVLGARRGPASEVGRNLQRLFS